MVADCPPRRIQKKIQKGNATVVFARKSVIFFYITSLYIQARLNFPTRVSFGISMSCYLDVVIQYDSKRKG